MKTIMDDLGWDKDKQDEIRRVVRETRESLRHIIFTMHKSIFPELYYVSCMNRLGLTHIRQANSRPLDTREEMIQAYDALIREFNLPYCCIMHKEELDPEPEFFNELNDSENEFVFAQADPDEFEFVVEDEPDFVFATDPIEFDLDDDEFDFA